MGGTAPLASPMYTPLALLDFFQEKVGEMGTKRLSLDRTYSRRLFTNMMRRIEQTRISLINSDLNFKQVFLNL